MSRTRVASRLLSGDAAWATFTTTMTASGSMTITSFGSSLVAKYSISGKTMHVVYYIASVQLGGTASTDILVTIPGGAIGANSVIMSAMVQDVNGTWLAGIMSTAAGSPYMTFNKIGQDNWSLASNARLSGQWTFEIQ